MDPAIKLFGTTIPLAEEEEEEPEIKEPEPAASPTEEQKETSKELANMEVNNDSATTTDEENGRVQISSSYFISNTENECKTSIAYEKEPANAKTEDNKTEADGSVPEKVLKKPDKILPCPRCNSMNTKFCYYNNYNVNQPRHFCRNCQRYWTAGGTMRNVPVGAGRRKSKHSAPQYHKLVITSDGLQSAQLDTLNLTHHGALPCVASSSSRPLIGNGTVLKFAQEVPLCESMASVLNIREQGKNGESGSMIHGENRDEPSCASSATASNFVENGSSVNAVHVEQSGMQVYSNGLLPLSHLQCCSGAPWAYPRIPAWSNVAAMEASRCSSEYACRPENGNSSSVPWNPKAMMGTTPFCAATFPFPFIPAPLWFCTTWPNGTGNVPWVGFNDCMSPSSSTSNSGCSGNGSPTLGKHSRDASLQSEAKMEKSLWVPKTLRIDDPEEAAKSSIWTTLGIKPDIGGIFQSNAANKAQKLDSAQVFHSNPAAFSRSQSFQEST